MTPLSDDLRGRIIAARTSGEGSGEVSQRFKVSRKSVERLWKQHSLTEACQPKKIGAIDARGCKNTPRRSNVGSASTPVHLQLRFREDLAVQIGINALWHRLD